MPNAARNSIALLFDYLVSSTMSKLSPAVKGLINAPFARPGQAPAPARIRQIYERIASEAAEKKYGKNPWVTLSVCYK